MVIKTLVEGNATSQSGPSQQRTFVISCRSVSSSLFPVWIPLGFLLGALFFWVPFSDFGVNELYLIEAQMLIRGELGTEDRLDDKKRPLLNRPEGSAFSTLIFFLSFIVTPMLCALLAISHTTNVFKKKECD